MFAHEKQVKFWIPSKEKWLLQLINFSQSQNSLTSVHFKDIVLNLGVVLADSCPWHILSVLNQDITKRLCLKQRTMIWFFFFFAQKVISIVSSRVLYFYSWNVLPLPQFIRVKQTLFEKTINRRSPNHKSNSVKNKHFNPFLTIWIST